MATDARETEIPAEVMADAQLIAECVAKGKPVPSDVARRVRDHAAAVTKRVREQHGLLDIAVPAIRELRGDLPNP